VWRGGTGKPLVLLQGGMADAELHWSCVWDALAEHYDVIAPDIPGFGGSDALRWPDWPGLCEWLDILLSDLGVARTTVVGNSFGGTLARAFATLLPERTDGLICVNGGPFIPVPEWMRVVLRTPVGGIWWRRRTRGSFTEYSLKRMMADASLLTPALIARMLHRSDALAPVLRACLSGFVPTTSPQCPTLVLWGEDDRHSPLVFARALEKQLPGSQLVTIAGAGHMPQFEKPDEFVSAVRAFAG
jgi:2-hydroxy-6-oxonona-2,4-dienedioate hydrolase